MYTLMSWIGATDDYTAPYPAKGETVFDLDDSLAISSDVIHVQNVSLVNLGERNAIKTMLMEHGAAHINFQQDYSKDNVLKISDNTVAYYYTGDKTTTNHAVTLIGWDDTFSRYNFATTPEADGAWLLQNSYGDNSKRAYVWISYYDPIISNPKKSVAFFEADPTFAYDNNYQYDGSLYSTEYKIKKSSSSFASVFEAKGYEYLKAVAFETVEPDLRYSIQIYRNPNSDDPTSGTPMLENPVTGVMQYEGYHTVPLTDLQNPSNRLRLVAGNKFAVVVTLSGDSDEISLPFEGVKEKLPYSRPYVLAGESYYHSSNGNWVDTSIWNSEELKVGNSRIKAYTSNAREGETWSDPAESPAPVLGVIFGLAAVVLAFVRRE